jgi:hypothetical protein
MIGESGFDLQWVQKIFFFFTVFRLSLELTQLSYTVGTRGCFPGGKVMG